MQTLPEPPAGLTGHGADEWRRVIRELQQSGDLQSVELTALFFYCEAFDRWMTAECKAAGSR